MRLSGLGSLTMGMLLLNAADDVGAVDGATCCLAKALRACGPWLSGSDRKSLSARLQCDGWAAIDDALFTKTGGWGTVSVSLPHLNDEEPQRTCEVRMSTNEQPWTTVAAAAAVHAWIVSTFPDAERQRSSSTIVTGQAARMTLWSGYGVKITVIAFESKQTSPNSDFILLIE